MSVMVMETRLLPDLLTGEQEVLLAQRMEAGVLAAAALVGTQARPPGATDGDLRELVALGLRAREHFILANLRLVAHEAHATARRTDVDFNELFQEGCVGLVQALERFDHRQGVRFSTYGQPWVRNAVLQHALRRGGMLEGPAWRNRLGHRLRNRLAELETQLGLPAALTVLAAETGRDEVWVNEVVTGQRRVSLEAVQFSTELACPRAANDFAACEDSPPDWLRLLGSQEVRVLSLLYGLSDEGECSYAQTAARMGVSVSTVRRLERRALEHARELLVDEEVVEPNAA
ncbi:sigma-70 family RNA polymerase sigma factor [Luteococcus sp. H138]|uniref:sigma-70 family RNA polymerase sigma factor n=1 Tax=unclassified Luteococcus TaxID=2639923 RepID=UPI00313ED5A5